MNKYIKVAIYYAVLGLISGVFYREFTKFNGVDGGTSLAYLHVHILALGMFFFMILCLFESKFKMSNFKGFKVFNITYNLGLHITLGVFIVRGVTEALGSNYSRAFDKSISGIAGIGHILLATGIITILIILNKASKKLEVYNQ